MVGPLQAGVLVCVMTDLRSCFNQTKAPPSELPHDNGVDEVKVPFRKVAVHEAVRDLIRRAGAWDSISVWTMIRERCDWDEFQDWAAFVSKARNSSEEVGLRLWRQRL